jgi:hypothetical protein
MNMISTHQLRKVHGGLTVVVPTWCYVGAWQQLRRWFNSVQAEVAHGRHSQVPAHILQQTLHQL